MRSRLVIQLQIWVLLIILELAAMEVAVAAQDRPIAKQGCQDDCGGVRIPFPFGIGVGCFLDPWFEIECNPSPKSKPFLSKLNNTEVIDLQAVTDGVQSIILRLPFVRQRTSSMDLSETPYSFSTTGNVLMAEGCSGSAVLRDKSNEIVAGCGISSTAVPQSSCYGEGCCQSGLLYSSHPIYHIDTYPQDEDSSNQSCIAATLIQSGYVSQYAGKLSSYATAPVILYWNWIGTQQPDHNSNVKCDNIYDDFMSCYCTNSSYGNAYLSNGCQVAEACKSCRGYCVQRYDDDSSPNSYYCEKKPLDLATILGLSISSGIVLLVIGIYGLYRFVKRIREIKRKAKFFKRNGGLLLHQQLSSNEGMVDGTKIFTVAELDKATNHFDKNRILGQGGQGTVYKGMLIDGSIVAIKKAKLLDESQLEQFINEVVILSQINHRNVVKLLGCCLETEVPLLVYEFIPNGTLFQHIHDPDEDFSLTWEKRLKIVLDSASAIAYLHSSSSVPIYHRDIKSLNILLDERHRAKISDFGSSKTIAIDQTHLTTLVQGTMGYLDPEYFQSYQFTDKSDVYSFGVILLELLTSKKPIYRDASSMEQKNLVTEFLSLMEDSALFNMLDREIVREAKGDELMAFVELAKRCINWSGKLRPTMKEVAMTLEMIINSPAQLSTWFQQQEDLGFAENTITESTQTSDGKFMSNPHILVEL